MIGECTIVNIPTKNTLVIDEEKRSGAGDADAAAMPRELHLYGSSYGLQFEISKDSVFDTFPSISTLNV
jgi:hypothetical protein